jgi:hypothetical protein
MESTQTGKRCEEGFLRRGQWKSILRDDIFFWTESEERGRLA